MNFGWFTSFSLVSLFCFIYSEEVNFDKSFEIFCEKHGGTIKKRSRNNVTEGDRCKATFNIPTSDVEEAKEMCQMWAPYDVKEAKPLDSSRTLCDIASPRFCRDKTWIMIWDRCFKLASRQHVGYDKAKGLCKSANSRIAVLNRARFTRIWKAFFPGILRLWVDTRNLFDHQIKTGKGAQTVLAFGMAGKAVGARGTSIIRAGKDMASSVLCEYIPPTTSQTYADIVSAISEVYYPTEIKDKLMYFRTTNFYGGVAIEDYAIEHRRCQNVMKIFGKDDRYRQPTKIADLGKLSERLKSAMFVAHLIGTSTRPADDCKHLRLAVDYQYTVSGSTKNWTLIVPSSMWAPDAPFQKCYMGGATVLIQQPKKKPVIVDVSRSFTAPMWCGVALERDTVVHCKAGTFHYSEKRGSICIYVEHRNMNYELARQFCNAALGKIFESDDRADWKYISERLFKGEKLRGWVGLCQYLEGNSVHKACFEKAYPICEMEKGISGYL